jgi:hypothetical protein
MFNKSARPTLFPLEASEEMGKGKGGTIFFLFILFLSAHRHTDRTHTARVLYLYQEIGNHPLVRQNSCILL